jgi:copper chaperone
MSVRSYSVPDMHCSHCKDALERQIATVEGVQSVDADLEAKLVTVRGEGFSDEALRAAIEEAGYSTT